ncbi:hypothetical protein [Bacillus thuringiensis]|uniref:hypothetical protein n=4 Tax=Bacillus cereus group TaxID=86661 RepID=UPI0020D216ED|nr:hypothetical protein [Bacillus thuringiensis]
MDIKESLEMIIKIGVIPVGMPIVYFMINNFNITDIEKKFLTNFQRLQIFVSNILISFIVGSIFMVFPLYNELLKGNNMKLFFLLVGIMSLIISVSVYIMKIIFEMFSPIRSTVFIEYEKEEWKILRVISKSQVVLSKKVRGEERYHGTIRYRDLKSVKEQDIKVYYELKKGKYSAFIRDISMRGNIFVIISNMLIFIAMSILVTIITKLNYFNAIGVLGSFFLFALILVIDMHIFYLKRVNEIHPEVLAELD